MASIDPVSFPLSRTLRFRDTNLETISLVNAPTDFDGVLTDGEGRVVSLWSSFAYHAGQDLEQVNKGVPADIVVEVIDHVKTGRPVRSLEAEFVRLPLSSARSLGLPGEWISRLEGDDPRRRQALQVLRVVAGTPAADVLRPGDLLLSVDGEVVTSFREVERRSQAEEVEVLIWRDGALQAQRLGTVALVESLRKEHLAEIEAQVPHLKCSATISVFQPFRHWPGLAGFLISKAQAAG